MSSPQPQPPTDLSTVLAFQPMEYLVPKQDIIPACAPFEIRLPDTPLSDTGATANTSLEMEVAQQVLNQQNASDLKYIKFKRPALKLQQGSGGGNSSVLSRLQLISPLEQQLFNKQDLNSKKDYVKPYTKVKRIKLLNNLNQNDIDVFMESAINADQLKIRSEMKYAAKAQQVNIEQQHSPTRNFISTATSTTTSATTTDTQVSQSMTSQAPTTSTSLSTDNAGAIEQIEMDSWALRNIENQIQLIGLTDDDIESEDNKFWIIYNEVLKDNNIADDTFILNIETLTDIESSLTRLWYSKNKLDRVPIDYMLRIQELVSKTLKLCMDVDWSGLNNSDFNSSSIRQLVHLACTGCKASINMMYLLTSGRAEKELYLEDYLGSTFGFTQKLGNELILLANTASQNISNEISQWFNILFQNFATLINQISTLIECIPIDESQITSLEYFAINTLYLEVDLKQRFRLIDSNQIEKLRVSVSNILIEIFKKYKEQRDFIVSEVIGNMNKLPHQKTLARQFRTSAGLNVQLVSFFLVRLIQSYNCSDFKFEQSYWDLLTSKNTPKQKEMINGINNKFFNALIEKSNEMNNMSNEIAMLLINKMNTILDANFRRVIENFLTDLLGLVKEAEYSGSETLLTSIMNTLLYICGSEKEKTTSNNVSTFCMELAGIIGSKIVSLKGDTTGLKLNVNSNVDEIKALDDYYWKILSYLKGKNKDNNDSKYDNFYLKYFNYFTGFTIKNQASLSDDSLIQINSIQTKLLNVFNGSESLHHTFNSSSNTDIESIYQNVLLSQDLLNQYDGLLNMVLKSLDSSSVKTRARAVKQLSLLITRDSSLLMVPSIKNSLAKRLNESYASVRDSIIELLSNYIKQNPSSVNEFAAIVAGRVSDDSISVRKKSITLVCQMYSLTQNIKIKSIICEKLLRRLDDEEDVVSDMASLALLDDWLINISRLYELGNLTITDEIRDTAISTVKVMIMVFTSGDKNWKYFERFLKEQVFHETNLNKANHVRLLQAISVIIEIIFEIVTENSSANDVVEIENAMGLLSILVKCNGSLISQDHLISLQPYLTDESLTGNSLCYYTLQIFCLTLPQMRALKPQFVDACESSLLKRLTKFNVRELDEAMPCVWYLCCYRNDTSKLTKACLSTLNLIKPYLTKIKNEPTFKPDSRIQRLLFLLGNFGRYCNFESHKNLFVSSKLGIKDNESTVSFIVKHILVFCKENMNPNLKRIAIKNLINVCISTPTLFLNDTILKIMDNSFDNLNDMNLQDAVINGLGIFLDLEEKKTIERNGLDNKDSKTIALDVQVFHGKSQTYVNDGICASLVQRYLNSILRNCLIDQDEHSLKAIHFLQQIVRLGFANPKLCIPTIIALESSPVLLVRQVALTMHEELADKHESLIESSYIEGWKLAVIYRRKFVTLKQLLLQTNFLKNFVKVSDVELKLTRMKKFIKSLLRSFSSLDDESIIKKPIAELQKIKDFVYFLCANISELDLKSQEIVLQLISGLEKLYMSISSIMCTTMEENSELIQNELVRLGLISSCSLILYNLKSNLCFQYGITSEKLMKFYESNQHGKEFRSSVTKNDNVNAVSFDGLYFDDENVMSNEVLGAIITKATSLL